MPNPQGEWKAFYEKPEENKPEHLMNLTRPSLLIDRIESLHKKNEALKEEVWLAHRHAQPRSSPKLVSHILICLQWNHLLSISQMQCQIMSCSTVEARPCKSQRRRTGARTAPRGPAGIILAILPDLSCSLFIFAFSS